jgi:transposase
MIRGGFLTEEDRGKLVALVRDGSAASRVTRRANALVLLDGGWSCQEVAAALLMDDDTIRGWHKLFEQRGIEGLTSFDMGGTRRFFEYRTRRRFESLRRRDAAALDAPGRRLDRTGIWPRLRKPFGTDRVVASPGARIS